MTGIELARRNAQGRMVRQTRFRATRQVPWNRVAVSYFLHRCNYEGRTKAILSGLRGKRSLMEIERVFATRMLPSGMRLVRRRHLRAQAVEGGVLVTAIGYPVGLVHSGRTRSSR